LKHRYDIIFYTGGGYVGQMVAEAAAKNLTPTILELGGKSPCVVDKTAGSIDVAARRTAWGFCGLNNGQTCVRPDYALVHADVAEEFLTKVEANIRQWYGGNARTSDSYGRIINQRAAVRLQQIIEGDKAYVRFGGESNPDEKFVEPTCMDFKEDFAAFTKSKSMEDEIFGPILPVFRYRNLDDAIKFINSNEKPLALYAFTGDTCVRYKILTETTSGVVSIHDCVVHLANPNLPFGGVGKSGMGSYHGKRSFDSFSHVKSVLVKTNYLDAPQRYPPYKEDPMLQAFLTPLDEDKKSVFKKVMYAAIAGAAYKVISSKL
jgi:aldehyde dehydrogenase (NAD+)